MAFAMFYSPTRPGQYVINPPDSLRGTEGYIQDVYEISICWTNSNTPTVTELGDRIKRAGLKWGVKDLLDLHIYPNGNFCLYPAPQERNLFPNGLTFQRFFERALIPFLYYQSHFERFGSEPWAGASHGILGILESYYHLTIPNTASVVDTKTYYQYLMKYVGPDVLQILRNTKAHHKCWCGSGKKVKHCHPEALWGLQRLIRDQSKLTFYS